MRRVLAARSLQIALAAATGGIRWLLRDDFTTDRAAGSVNGTAAEPGPGTRTVVDTKLYFSITSGELFGTIGTQGGWSNPSLRYASLPRVAGRIVVGKQRWISGDNANRHFGFFQSIPSGYDPNEYSMLLDNRINASGVLVSVAASSPTAGAVVLRAAGCVFFGSFSGKWILSWITSLGSVATLCPGYSSAGHQAGNHALDFLRVPDALWLPTPLASDGFGSAFGTTDGLGHAEGIAGGIGAGGGGVTWSNVGGTWSVSGGKAINTTPSGLSQQISVLSTGNANVFASGALTWATGSVGLVLSMDSASSPANGVLVYLDGTNCKVDEIVSGVTSNVRTTIVTYSAGATLVVAKTGTEYRVYYNNALVGAYTIADASIVSNTLHGVFSTDASNTLDNFVCYATGTGGEYSYLDTFTGA